MPPDFDQFQVGAVVQPLATSSGNTLLQDADPALYYALDFWSFVIRTYPGPRLLQALTAARITAPHGSPITDVVAQAYPYEPLPEYLENQIQFPALFAFRVREHTEQWTAAFDHDVVEVRVAYVLPPLDAAGAERILPILNAVKQALRAKTNMGWDPAYAPPGGVLGDQWNGPKYANLQEVGFSGAIQRRVVSTPTVLAEYGHLPGTGDLWMPTLTLSAYWIEKDEYNPTRGGPSTFDGADITGNVAAEDGTVVPATASGVVQASVQRAPAITSLDVTSGPSAGGTSVNVTGLRFLSGPPQVFFGPASAPTYATSVAFNSPTSLTVVTPAMQGAGDVSMTITNRDGQSATLADAFTFT